MARIAGKLFVDVNGTRLSARGENWNWNLGRDKREMVVGVDGPHGHKAMPQVPFLEGEISLTPDLDLEALLAAEDATVTAELPNGWTFVLRSAIQTAEATAETGDGKMPVRFEGLSADLSRAA